MHTKYFNKKNFFVLLTYMTYLEDFIIQRIKRMKVDKNLSQQELAII